MDQRNESEQYAISVADPAEGILNYIKEEFHRCRISTQSKDKDKGIALVLYSTTAFYDQEDDKGQTLLPPRFLTWGNWFYVSKRF